MAASDMGRRIEERRVALGLRVEDVAERAGVDANYLASLEWRGSSAISPAALNRLAGALDTTVEALSGGLTQEPPGRRSTGSGAPIRPLEPAECHALIAGGGVGRVVFVDDRGPVALPVNFAMDGGDVVFRTERDAVVAALDHREPVSFEVDNLDDALAEGWSVLLTGECTVEEGGSGAQVVDVHPWAAGDRSCVVKLRPRLVTGRRIRRP